MQIAPHFSCTLMYVFASLRSLKATLVWYPLVSSRQSNKYSHAIVKIQCRGRNLTVNEAKTIINEIGMSEGESLNKKPDLNWLYICVPAVCTHAWGHLTDRRTVKIPLAEVRSWSNLMSTRILLDVRGSENIHSPNASLSHVFPSFLLFNTRHYIEIAGLRRYKSKTKYCLIWLIILTLKRL